MRKDWIKCAGGGPISEEKGMKGMNPASEQTKTDRTEFEVVLS